MAKITVRTNGQTLTVNASVSHWTTAALAVVASGDDDIPSTTTTTISSDYDMHFANTATSATITVKELDGTTLVAQTFQVGPGVGPRVLNPVPDPYQLGANTSTLALAVPYESGSVYRPPGIVTLTTGAATQSRLELVPWPIHRTVTIDRLINDVTTGAASSFMRPVIYKDDGTGLGGTLVVDGGQVDASGIGQTSATVDVTLSPGLYYVGAVAQGGTPTTRYISVMASEITLPVNNYSTMNFGIRVLGVTGAPSAAVTWAASDIASNAHATWFRVA